MILSNTDRLFLITEFALYFNVIDNLVIVYDDDIIYKKICSWCNKSVYHKIYQSREHHPGNCALRRYRQQFIAELNIVPSDNEQYTSSEREQRISFEINVDYD